MPGQIIPDRYLVKIGGTEAVINFCIAQSHKSERVRDHSNASRKNQDQDAQKNDCKYAVNDLRRSARKRPGMQETPCGLHDAPSGKQVIAGKNKIVQKNDGK